MPAFDPNYGFEDKIIMSLVDQIERDWYYLLNDAQRAAWQAHWATVAPVDITHRAYVIGTPSKFGETKVAVDRCYAWSQIYGVQRFHFGRVLTPVTTGLVLPSCSNLILTENSFTIDYDATASGRDQIPLLVFADGPPNPSPDPLGKTVRFKSSGKTGGLRPMCAMPNQPPTGTLDFWACWHKRFGPATPLGISATVAAVDVDNQLCPSLDVLTSTVSGS
jgi:hypothetical protein